LGGGIFMNGGVLTLVNDTFTGNTAAGGAGGLGVSQAEAGAGAGSPGKGYGGGVFALNGTLTATFVTFSANAARSGAGNALQGTDLYALSDKTDSGVHGGGTLSAALIDDILGQSSAATSDLVANSVSSGSTPSLSGQHDVISNNSPSSGSGLPTGPTIVIGDPKLGVLGANGGPTPTLSLQTGSPAIAAGVTADYPGTSTPITIDQRGDARAGTPSIGAFESTLAATPTITLSTSSLALGTTTAGTAGYAQSFTISGTNLAAAVSVAAPSGVEMSDDGGQTWSSALYLNESGGTLAGTTIEARISAGAGAGNIGGSIASTSTGATAKDVAVSGTITAAGTPTILVSTTSLSLGTTTAGTPGTAQSYTIGGVSLSAAITVAAPSGVQISDDGGNTWNSVLTLTETGGAIASMTILARISPAAGQGVITGSITSTSSGANENDVSVSGTVGVGIETLAGNIVASLSQSSFGQDVTLTATFSAARDGSEPMTGTVSFYDGSTYLGTAPLSATGGGTGLRGGLSSLLTSSLAVGKHNVTAVYSGDDNYTTASTDIPVSVQVAPAATSLRLSASAAAEGTMLTANVVVTSPGNPPVAGFVSFYEPGTLIGTVPVSNGVASLSVGWLPKGSHAFSAVFSGGGALSTSQSSLVVTADGPRLTAVVRYGLSGQPAYLLLYFNSPLDAASAQNSANYTITGPGNRRIKVRRAIYDSANDTVTLVPKGPLNLRERFQLKVNGKTRSGLTNPVGALLDGGDKGRPGSNFAASITRKSLAGPDSQLPTLGLI
jgi:large repetitive protein